MKREYESPEFIVCKVYLSEDVLSVSTDQSSSSEIGGDGPSEDWGDW